METEACERGGMMLANAKRLTYNNPVIPGFFPDPSIAKAGEDYYLATSSFEYFPGVPLFHSKNLVDWKQIGHVLTRPGQLDLSNRNSSDGVYAPTLRYHDGTFYLITTDVRGKGNFYVTADKPEGPWSDPILLPYGGIDPSLMFDDDGTVYVTVQSGSDESSHIIQYEIDIETGQVLTQPQRIWDGDGGVWTEGPHLYKINGLYYVVSACGGTGLEHRVIVGRSVRPYGPFEPCPYPILTHNKLPEHPLQCLGHADLIEDNEGRWWAVFLGTRPVNGCYSVLGRETFLAPVVWTEEGWPLIDNNAGTVAEQMTIAGVPEAARKPLPEWNAIRLDNGFGVSWSFLRTFDPNRYQTGDRPGEIRLIGNSYTLDDEAPATFASVRQSSRTMKFSCQLDYAPRLDGEEAGIAIRLNNRGYIIFSVKCINGSVFLNLSSKNGERKHTDLITWYKRPCHLTVESDASSYWCSYSEDGITWMRMFRVIKAEWLSPEVNGGFTGVCVGLYATGGGVSGATPAIFSAVAYSNLL